MSTLPSAVPRTRTLLASIVLVLALAASIAILPGVTTVRPVAPALPHVSSLSAPASVSPAPASVQVRTTASWGGPGDWTMQRDYGANNTNDGFTVLGASCVTNASYMVCVGGQTVYGDDISNVYYSPLALYTNYSIQTWDPTTDYGATHGYNGTGGEGMEWPSCVYSGGYIYCVGGANNSGIVSKTFYAPFLATGGVGAWTETTDYGGTTTTDGTGGIPSQQLRCVALDSYIYCLGANSAKVFYAPLSSSGIGAWTETTDYGAASGDQGTHGYRVDDPSCALNGTDMICVGGFLNGTVSSGVFFAPLSASGVGAWTETTDYGAESGTSGTGGLPLFGISCANGGPNGWWIVCVGGGKASDWTVSYVYYAQVSATGGVGAWTNDTIQFGVGEMPLEGSHGGADAPTGLRPDQNDIYNDDCFDWWLTGDFQSFFLFCVGGLSNAVYGVPLWEIGDLTTELSASSAAPGQSVTDSVTLTPEVFFIGGDLQYFVFDYSSDCGGAPLSLGEFVVPAVGSVSDSNSYTIPAKATGTFSFMAVFYGDEDEEPVESDCELLTITGNSYTPSLSTSLSATSASVGQSVTDASTLTNADPSGITGSIIYYYSLTECPGAGTEYSLQTTTAGGAQPSSSAYTIPSGASGTIYFWATYTGDTNDASATSPCEPLTVTTPTKNSPSVTTQLSSTTVADGGTDSDVATLSGASASPTGYIDYYYATACPGTGALVNAVTVTANGAQASSGAYTIPSGTTGTVYFWAYYTGDANNNPATSACEPVTVSSTPPYTPQLTTSLSTDYAAAGESLVDTATLTGASPTAGGTITYQFLEAGCPGGSPSDFATVSANGNGAQQNSGAFTLPSSVAGMTEVYFQAVYSGDASDTTATSPCEPLNIVANPAYHPTLTTLLSKTTVEAGGDFSDSASLIGADPSATGQVYYYFFDNAQCSSPSLTSDSVTLGTGGSIPSSSSFTVPVGASGQLCVMAFYGGDANDDSAWSEPEYLDANPSPSGSTSSSGFHEGPFVGTTGEEEVAALAAGGGAVLVLLGFWMKRRKVAGLAPVAPAAAATASSGTQDVDDDETDTPPSAPPASPPDDAAGAPQAVDPSRLATEETATPDPPATEATAEASGTTNPTEQVM